MPELLAMAPSGDVLVTRHNGRCYLHLPAGAGGVRSIAHDQVDRYVTKGDLDLVKVTFPSWPALEAAVNERVAVRFPPSRIDSSQWDATDIADMLHVAKRLMLRGEGAQAVSLLDHLARLRQVRADDRHFNEVMDLRRTFERPVVSMHQFATVPSPVIERAHAQWQAIAA